MAGAGAPRAVQPLATPRLACPVEEEACPAAPASLPSIILAVKCTI